MTVNGFDDDAVYDVLIIGGSFSGLTAALTLARQLHTAVVFDSESYRNARSKHLHVMPAWDYQDPETFRAAARRDLNHYDTIQFRRKTIKSVAKGDNGLFEATDTDGGLWHGRKVILASGVQELYPGIPGYENLKNVTIYTNGNENLAQELSTSLKGQQQYHIDHRVISSLAMVSNFDAQIEVTFADDANKREAFLAHSPFTRAKGSFAEQLGLKLTATGDYEVQPPFSATSAEGVFAAGDVTTMFKVATNAIASGSMVGAGVSARIQEEQMGMKSVF
ncbi:MAG: hypothetical protein Q9165_008253 [Trypethelium subeluteriae]